MVDPNRCVLHDETFADVWILFILKQRLTNTNEMVYSGFMLEGKQSSCIGRG